MAATKTDLTHLTIDAVEEAGKVQGRFEVLGQLLDDFPKHPEIFGWAETRLTALLDKNREVYSMLRAIE